MSKWYRVLFGRVSFILDICIIWINFSFEISFEWKKWHELLAGTLLTKCRNFDETYFPFCLLFILWTDRFDNAAVPKIHEINWRTLQRFSSKEEICKNSPSIVSYGEDGDGKNRSSKDAEKWHLTPPLHPFKNINL